MTGPSGATDAVASPCVSVCVMLPEAGVCAGCFRTLDEIAAWSQLDPAQKRAVLAALAQRRVRWAAIARAVTAPEPPCAGRR